MCYYLNQYLQDFDIPGMGMFAYVSFRSLMALIVSLVISMWAGEYFIKYMHRKMLIEGARSADIDPYGVQKKDVPSMGGIVILAAIVVPALLFGSLTNVYVLLLIATALFFGFLGFIDDKIKLKGNKDGLSPRVKMLGQLVFGGIIGVTLWLSPQAVVRENVVEEIGVEQVVYHKSEARKSTVTTVPFCKNNNIDYYELFSFLPSGKAKRACGWLFFVLFTTIVITAVSNYDGAETD